MISLSDVKTLCVSEINLGNKDLRRFSKTLATSLCRTLVKLIGLKSVTCQGL